MLYINEEASCPMKYCNKCDSHKYKKQSEKYKRKYEIAKSGLTKEERDILVELICNEQIKNILIKNEYDTEKYSTLEKLKAKIRVV